MGVSLLVWISLSFFQFCVMCEMLSQGVVSVVRGATLWGENGSLRGSEEINVRGFMVDTMGCRRRFRALRGASRVLRWRSYGYSAEGGIA